MISSLYGDLLKSISIGLSIYAISVSHDEKYIVLGGEGKHLIGYSLTQLESSKINKKFQKVIISLM